MTWPCDEITKSEALQAFGIYKSKYVAIVKNEVIYYFQQHADDILFLGSQQFIIGLAGQIHREEANLPLDTLVPFKIVEHAWDYDENKLWRIDFCNSHQTFCMNRRSMIQECKGGVMITRDDKVTFVDF